MQRKYVIGLNSGTSFDGIDVALVQFKNGSLVPIFIDGFVYKYPIIVKEKIRRLVVGAHGHASLREISQLNFLLGKLFASAALKMIKKIRARHGTPLLIASHGQTIYHHPEIEKIAGYKIRSTLQIGESSVISERTGIQTISNFREADIAAGGQGAPLMPFLDWIVFGCRGVSRYALLNIGGISNVTIVGGGIKPIAFDIGPGNALIDLIVKIYFKKDFDKDGEIAGRGRIFFDLADRALRDPYFKKKPPKSTGKEYFNEQFIKKYFSKIKRREDKIATVTYFSALVIKKAFNDFVFLKYIVKEIVISGGGIKNKILMRHLTKLFSVEACHGMPLRLVLSDKYGLPSKYKEAMLFALLGYTCQLRKPNNMPSCTGAKKNIILGKITDSNIT